MSGLVNEAYNTLLHPLSRIRYILSQHNLDVLETDQLTDPLLISEIIEIRETLEDASSEIEVEEIKNDVAGLRETMYKFSPADDPTGKISATLENIKQAVHLENWDEAHREAVRLKFLRGIEAAAQSWPNTDH
jgi:molecular chaperone HscB